RATTPSRGGWETFGSCASRGSWASQSSATAAVHDWAFDPSGSPATASAYSLHPDARSWATAAVRNASARLWCPSRSSAHHSSHVITGHVGPRQYERGSNAGSSTAVDGGTAQRRPGAPANDGPAS